MSEQILVGGCNEPLNVDALNADTLRWLGDCLEVHADMLRVWETHHGPSKLRHAGSALLRLWAANLRTDANTLEASDGV